MNDNSNQPPNEFQKAASTVQIGIVHEFVTFLRQNKKWWLLPIIVVMLLFAALLIIGGSGAAPFIYTLF